MYGIISHPWVKAASTKLALLRIFIQRTLHLFGLFQQVNCLLNNCSSSYQGSSLRQVLLFYKLGSSADELLDDAR